MPAEFSSAVVIALDRRLCPRRLHSALPLCSGIGTSVREALSGLQRAGFWPGPYPENPFPADSHKGFTLYPAAKGDISRQGHKAHFQSESHFSHETHSYLHLYKTLALHVYNCSRPADKSPRYQQVWERSETILSQRDMLMFSCMFTSLDLFVVRLPQKN